MTTIGLIAVVVALLAVLAWGLWRVFRADVREADATNAGAGYIHTVGYVQGVWSALLGAAPRARCGASLAGDPSEPALGPDAPKCPDCVRREGRTLHLAWAPHPRRCPMIRTIVTLGSAATVALGCLNGETAAIVGGLVGLALVVLSCRLAARNGEWSR